MPKKILSFNKETKGSPKPQDIISCKILDVKNFLTELTFEFNTKKKFEKHPIYTIQNDKQHLSHLTDTQRLLLLSLLDICVWIVGIILYQFWSLHFNEEESKVKRLVRFLTKAKQLY